MDLEELVARMETARQTALELRDERRRKADEITDLGQKMAYTMSSHGHHAVAVALGQILGKDTPPVD